MSARFILLSRSTNVHSQGDVIGASRDADATISQESDRMSALNLSPSSKKPTLAGSWILTVNIPDNAPPFDSFKALWCLMGDGLLVASALGHVAPTPFPAATLLFRSRPARALDDSGRGLIISAPENADA